MVVFWTNRSDGLPVSPTWCEYLRLELPVRRISAPFYDMLYEGTKDFRAEANRLRGFFNARNVAPGNPLLDVACGTGQHLAYLQMDYQVEGLDADPGMLALAAKRIPNVPLHQADMRDFDLGRQFQIMTCLFSAIGYMTSVRDLRRAIRTMARHLRADGVLIVEPWFTPERWHDGREDERQRDERASVNSGLSLPGRAPGRC